MLPLSLLTVFLGYTTVLADVLPRQLGHFYVGHPAFVELYKTANSSVDVQDQYTLYISNFNPLTLLQPDYIYYIPSPGRSLATVDSWTANVIDKTNYWPNDVIYLPGSVVGREGIIWTSGFLVPSKTKGKLNIYFTDTSPPEGPHNIASLDEEDWSYHRVIWRDVNGDGHDDAVTERFHTSLLGATTQQLVWLQNPGDGSLTDWPQQVVLAGGADIHFQLAQLQAGGRTYDVVINAEFFNKKLTIYYAEDGANFWTDPSTLKSVEVDAPGQPFDVYFEDLNRDGKKEILTTVYDGSVGSVFVYKIPDDFRSGTFERTSLATDFVPNLIIGGQAMSPGAAHLFYPSTAHEESGNKPYILLSGDDDGKHYILSAESEDKDNWTYQKNVLYDTKMTTSGKSAVADVDGDGYVEIVAAGYTAGQVYVFTYEPK